MNQPSHYELRERALDGHRYLGPDYLDDARWASYREAIREIMRIKPGRILEIGPGNGIVSRVCDTLGITVYTLDINPAVSPDIIGSVVALPIMSGAVDLVLAQQVLEHLPFDCLAPIMRDISRITDRAIITLPHISLHLTVGLKLPRLSWRTMCVTIPIGFGRIGKPHCWELGMNVKVKEVRRCFAEADFEIEKEFRTPEHPYYHFFVLKRMPQILHWTFD